MQLKIIDEGKPVGYLQGSMAEDLNSGLPRTNPASGQSGTWNRNIPISNRSTTLPPSVVKYI